MLTAALVGARLDAMLELPRTVFLLRHVDGLEVAAIGVRLGLAAEDVERELAPALRVLAWGSAEAEAGPVAGHGLVDRAGLRAVADPERVGEGRAVVGVNGGAVAGAEDGDIGGAGIDDVGAERFEGGTTRSAVTP